jgi:hypothetical protein
MSVSDGGPFATKDTRAILRLRRANGGDYWATADGRWGVGSPFSTLDAGLMLTELGLKPTDRVARGIAGILFACQTKDGRIRPGPRLAVQPCHSASAARLLCRLGYADDERLSLTLDHLLETQAPDGGWRCGVMKFGAGPDTDASNPGVTLSVLDALRFRLDLLASGAATRAVETLLHHWSVRRPLGPCRFGIGSRFLQVEYPLFRYNVLSYLHVLSFYPHARKHTAFAEALHILRSKLVGNDVVVEHTKPGLEVLELCRTGSPSPGATRIFAEILGNFDR